MRRRTDVGRTSTSRGARHDNEINRGYLRCLFGNGSEFLGSQLKQGSSSRLASVCVFLVVAVVVCIAGCEENIGPSESLDAPFTMYGMLSPDLDTQTVQIFVPEQYLRPDAREKVDVAVFSTEKETGERVTWKHSAHVDADGVRGHVFWALFRPDFGHTYRVEAIRPSDGARSYADVRIPPPVTIQIEEETAPLLQVYIEGDDVRVLEPRFEYVVGYPGGTPGEFSITVDYSAREQRTGNDWTVVANMIVDYEEIRFIVRASNLCREVVTLDTLKLHVLIGDGGWDPPGGTFDPNVLAVPGVMTNVQNGLGFIGGGYRKTEYLYPSREAVESACFIYAW